ncbi:hypothetical protein SAMN05421821_101399 [Mucilaginibacter lappiensis]|uniref:Swt1-like HEPN domain-containing protein n=1 Tax=Mucilaginibacter lappiensis TaxID=354630 RepID=A0ABR6PEM0_9SPHI|nr:Swt1 family HEPN domain-containing protein [Mucilaginibacter lappiensis]MBB6107684.1 hypothetical protein [Mucilaginibacter lappiensis]SIQ00502.1 hypothetical protein SAMN05421821_101399 [Mucilaginibacter lappiensis]
MTSYTNEAPDDLQVFLNKLKLYLDKAYSKPDKEKLKRLLASAKIDIQKTGRWGSIHAHAEAKVVFYVLYKNLELITPGVKENLKNITYQMLQAENCGLEVTDLEFFPVASPENVSVEEELMETIEAAKQVTNGINLPAELIAKGKEMSEAYLYIYFVENALRLFIEKIQGQKPLDFPRDVTRTIEKNKNNEAQSRFLPLRGNSDLFYCDFVQLQQIIVHNWEYFKEYFPQQDQHWLRVKIEDMYRVRNLIAHCGYISKEELQMIKSNFKMILRQLKFQDNDKDGF